MPGARDAIGRGGLAGALDRLDRELATGRPPQVPVLEALGWLRFLQELHRQARHGRLDYYDFRKLSEDGNTYAALVWARGNAAHAHALVTNVDHLYPSPTLYPSGGLFPGETWRWVPRDALPPEPDKKYHRDVLYASHVAQHHVRAPLARAVSFLATL